MDGSSPSEPESEAPAPEGIPSPLTVQATDNLRIEELGDKLIEKREKLEYFLITASTAVIVFSFNDFNRKDGLLQGGHLWLTMIAWSLLLLSPAGGLLAIRRRHTQYALSQQWLREERHQAKDEKEKRKIERGTKLIQAGDSLMALSFLLGIAILALSYSYALLRRP